MLLKLRIKSFLGIFTIIFAMGTTLFSGVAWGQTIQTIASGSGSWAVPCGVTSITVQVWGGGGGGGRSSNNNQGGTGGSGGGYSVATITVTPGQSFAYVVGAGGNGGTNGTATAGGPSNFGGVGFISATGGGPGVQNMGGQGAVGTGTVGAPGATGVLTQNGSLGEIGTTTYGGAGGNSGSGSGGAIRNVLANTAGALGTIGGGGAGGLTTGGPSDDGGAGGAGQITITFTGPNAGADQTLAACATTTTLAANTPAGGGTGTWTCVSGCAGVTITTPTSPTSTVTGLVIGTNTVLRWTWTGGGGCASVFDEVTINTTMGPGCLIYCASNWTDPDDEYISQVTFGTINQAIGVGSYSSHLGSCATFTQGQSGNLCVSMIMNGAWNNNVHAFFDWDQNGTFETDVDLGNQAGSGTLCTSVSIPCDAVPGTVRMRILIAEGATEPTGCTSGTFGDAADFCITVIAATTPISNAGPDQNINCASSATLNAAASVPASGSWTLVSGTGTITNPASPTSTVTGMSNGANVFQWTAYGTCATDEATVTINVAGLPNVPVSAGNDIFSCTQGLSLDGSDPAPFTGQWVVISGPNTPTFTPAASANNAQISGLINGAYVLQWQVNTTSCGVLSDQMTFTFGSLPTSNAGPDQTICPTGAVLNGNDFDGAIGTWSVLSGPAGSGFVNVNDPNTMIYNLVAGSYVLHWTVSGGGCAGGTFDAVTITVNSCTTPVLHGTSANQSLTGCSYTYTDNGGPAGAYSANISQTWTTFCPDNPSAFSTITVNTAGFFPGDYMLIYDSPGAGAPIVGAYYYSSSGSGGTIGSPALGTTITSSTGCLYVQMNSSASNQNFGWTSTIGCSLTQGIQSQTFVSDQNCGGGGGITLCSSGSVTTSSNNSNNPPDLGFANNGCLGSLEGTSNKWAYINVSTDGWLTFQISPAGGQDFDYAVWGPYPGGYSCPGVTLDDPIRCSWAANGGSACPSTIGLGALNTAGQAVLPSDVSEGGFCSATNEGWTYPIYALAGQVYVVLFQNYGSNNSTFGFNVNTQSIPSGGSYATLGCTPPQPLPVELVSFIGEHKDRNNYIYWNTASEHMNDYFTIEKSKDGMTWSLLTSVTGAGFSNEMNHYSTIDENPFVGITYYRLIQTDFDGKKRDYKTIAISTDIEIEDMFSNVFPNPTQNSFYFNYGGKDFNSEIIVNVYNSIGQLVINESLSNFNSSQSMEIDTKDLIDGFYQVEIIQNEKREIKKLSIVK